ncbi:hypothetical protein H4R99_004306 [Coemansia sp. RSA 1722]|nr:hypothetical protein H4R99_004306 [Coemansia sp. RSA 1722]
MSFNKDLDIDSKLTKTGSFSLEEDHDESVSSKAAELPVMDTTYGWVVALSSSFILMISVGLTNSFGIYLTEYQLNVFPSTPTSTLSWIGSLQFGAMTLFGVGAGILAERFDTRIVVVAGSISTGLSLIIASFCRSPIGLVFTQGILFGISGSCLMVPSMSLVSQWMQKYRAVAGGSLGGLWSSYATEAFVAKLGWEWSLRITGFIVIAIGCVAGLFMRKRIHIARRDRLIDFGVLLNTRFLFLFSATVLAAGSYFIPFYFMPSYIEVVIGKPSFWGANISSILSASGVIGRIAMGMLADCIGPFNAVFVSSLLSSVAMLVLWLPFENLGTLVASATLFGLASGSIVSLVPVMTAALFGIKRLPSILGLLLISYTIGVFIGAPVGGVLLDKYGQGSDYRMLIAYGGALFAAASILFVVLRFIISPKLFVVV